VSFETEHFIECENNLKLSVCGCLDVLGISLLSECDVLAFVHRHGVSLTSVEQIARLLGYEDSVVESALDRLERETLIGRSRPSRGVCFYRLMAIPEPERKRSLEYLIDVLETRGGRVLLRRQMNSTPSERVRKEQQMGGNHYA
jgi:hypothetical protein